LPFTADEVWGAMPAGASGPSVHLEEFAPSRPERREPDLEGDWETILRARQAVTRELEGLRERKEIGSSLAAEVEIAAVDQTERAILERHLSALEEAFIVSAVHVRGTVEADDTDEALEGFRARARPASGEKCDRCWRWRTSVGDEPDHPTLCEECVSILSGLS
jgi:isoleucyl-tRNA synthetase